ncbi:hypothetical protein a10_07304 [Streptomyces acidiscabies]|nr:hypothetical protein a10_07304 [Streptomyces acidiscabies]
MAVPGRGCLGGVFRLRGRLVLSCRGRLFQLRAYEHGGEGGDPVRAVGGRGVRLGVGGCVPARVPEGVGDGSPVDGEGAERGASLRSAGACLRGEARVAVGQLMGQVGGRSAEASLRGEVRVTLVAVGQVVEQGGGRSGVLCLGEIPADVTGTGLDRPRRGDMKRHQTDTAVRAHGIEPLMERAPNLRPHLGLRPQRGTEHHRRPDRQLLQLPLHTRPRAPRTGSEIPPYSSPPPNSRHGTPLAEHSGNTRKRPPHRRLHPNHPPHTTRPEPPRNHTHAAHPDPPCRPAALPPCRPAALPPCRPAALPPCRPAALPPCRREGTTTATLPTWSSPPGVPPKALSCPRRLAPHRVNATVRAAGVQNSRHTPNAQLGVATTPARRSRLLALPHLPAELPPEQPAQRPAHRPLGGQGVPNYPLAAISCGSSRKPSSRGTSPTSRTPSCCWRSSG